MYTAYNLTDPYYRGVTTPYQEWSVVPTRNFTPRLSSLSTYLSRAIGDKRILNSKYASVHRVQTFEYLWKTHRGYSSIPLIGDGDSLRPLVSRRSIPITRIQSRGRESCFAFLLSAFFPFFFFFPLSRTMLFHLHSVFTSRAFHASRLFLFAQLSFFSCPFPSCLLVFYVFYSLVPFFFSLRCLLDPSSVFSAFIC